MAQNAIKEEFSDFGGLDYRSNSITRSPRFAREANNTLLLKNNSLSLRPGSKGKARTYGGGGIKSVSYRDVDGVMHKELLTIDSVLGKLKEGTITITYTGAETNVIFSVTPVLTGTTYSFYAKLTEDTTEVFSQDLETGVNDASPYTVASLVTAIDALADYTCSYSGDTANVPAAFLDNQVVGLAPSTATNISYFYYNTVDCPTVDPFLSFSNSLDTETGGLASIFSHANRIFIATGFNKLYKYDSVSAYAAGMPAATALSSAIVAGPGITGDYEWFITYEQLDALGNYVEGDASNSDTETLANQKGRITIPTIQPTSEYLTSQARANNAGTETGTTLTVDAGHGLEIGHYAYFIDNGGAEVERKITATTATTITIAGAAVTIANNEVISAGLRINLWRNVAGSTEIFYLVRTFANDSSVTSFTYDDATADASLIVQYEFPVVGHGTPPEDLRYLTSYNNLLVGADGTEDVYYSDVDGPEYWNTSFSVNSKSNSPVTRIGANKDALMIFKEDEGHVLTGDLANTRYRLQALSDEVGCSSHHSIVDVDGTLWFYSSRHGPRRVVSSNLPDDVSFRVLPVILDRSTDDTENIAHSRVVAVDYHTQQLVLFYLPKETEVSALYYPNNNSLILAADYRTQFEEDVEYDEQGRATARVPKIRWWRWTGLNMGAGADMHENELVFQERRYTDAAAMEYSTCRLLETLSEYDYCDHAEPIEFEYESYWFAGGKPDVLKKINRIAVYSFPETIATSFSIVAETQLDFIEGAPHSTKTLVFGESGVSGGWGTGPWGEFAWGDLSTPKVIFPLRPTKAGAIKIRLSGDFWLEFPVVSGWSIEMVPVFAPKVGK